MVESLSFKSWSSSELSASLLVLVSSFNVTKLAEVFLSEPGPNLRASPLLSLRVGSAGLPYLRIPTIKLMTTIKCSTTDRIISTIVGASSRIDVKRWTKIASPK